MRHWYQDDASSRSMSTLVLKECLPGEKIMQTEAAHYTLVPILNAEDGDGSSAVDVDSM